MLTFIWRVVIVLTVLWLMRTFLGYFFPRLRKPGGRGQGGPGDLPSQKMVRDPVCGTYIDPRLAVRLESGKDTLSFCSRECMEKYRAGDRG